MSTLAPGPPAPTTPDRGRRPGRVRRALPVIGPAFVAGIAYVDPGNVATNFSAGAAHGYLLVWVVVGANLVAMLVQALAAKAGLATGRSLPELSRTLFPGWVTRGLWLQAELVVVATDLAEIIGGAVALHLLLGLPLVAGGLVTGLVAYGLVALRAGGRRPFERVVMGLFAVISGGFLLTLLCAHPRPADAAAGLVPRLDGGGSLVLAVGILGATVMPHAIYLHSALPQGGVVPRGIRDRRRLLGLQRVDILAALGLAGVVNVAMLLSAAALFGDGGVPAPVTVTLEGVHAALGSALGAPVAVVFALALLASGLASAGVGTCAGEVVMTGYLRRRVPPALRRLGTLAPSLVVLAVGVDPLHALVLSQLVLSFGIPFALVPLILVTRDAGLMRELVNRPSTTVAAWLATALVVGLNAVLVVVTLGS